jgi:alpha-L-rhamnosidase
MWNFHGKAFWEKFLDDIETSRAINGGLPCNIAPGKRTGGTANPDWAAAFVMLPWYAYVQYGDRTVLEKHWSGMQDLMQHWGEQSHGWILEGGFGDWFDPGGESICTHTPPTLTTTFWFHQCAVTMRSVAAVLGRPDAAERYANWASLIRDAVATRYFRRDRGSFGSQTANAMALQFGLVPTGEEQRVLDALVRDLQECNMHLNTGIMGVRFVFEALTRNGHGELALALMHQDTYPGFGDWILRGATTLWECWGEEEHDRNHGARSLNHPMMGGFDNWFFNTLAGIRPDPAHPGFQRFFLDPHPIHGLDWIRMQYDCPQGRIVSEWNLSKDRFGWKVVVPRGSTATATLPYAHQVHMLEPGTHHLIDNPTDRPLHATNAVPRATDP